MRQRPIGNYIIDFYAPEANLVIEVDGSLYFKEDEIEYDKIRDVFLGGQGLTVLRFTNIEILENIESVIEIIEQELIERLNGHHPSSVPP